MPTFNEEERLGETLADLRATFLDASSASCCEVTVFVVDDGSMPPIDQAAARSAAPFLRIVFARHAVNLGQGAALETARRLALAAPWQPAAGAFDAFVTMDSDGQHRARDVLAMARAIEAGADVALGDRFKGGSKVPGTRRLLLACARAFERVTTGLQMSDVHNGLRAFGPRAIGVIRIRQNRMAHATEISRRIARAAAQRDPLDVLRVVEVPVAVLYTRASLAKGQRASGAIAIVMDLFYGFLFGNEPRG